MKEASKRVLVFAATQRDAESTCDLFLNVGVECVAAKSFSGLLEMIDAGAGTVIIAKEGLGADSVRALTAHLDRQPKWSFLPLIILAANGDLNKGASGLDKILSPLRNLTLLERPVRASTLISVVRAAVADRQRQYDLRDLLAELEVSKTQAVAANEAKSSFLANMSHEIRTPLGIILGFSDFLADPETSVDEREKYAQTIRRNGQLLSSLIDDVLDLAKVEAGHMTVERSDIATRELLAEVISAMQPRVFAKKVGLTLTVKPGVPWVIQTDATRFKQILINIIGNAIKFTSKGEISLVVDRDGPKLKVTVSDTGIGISAEQAEHLFSAFSQADSSITRRFGGTGLGLVLSKRIAQALGGDLTLQNSAAGEGSVFDITIDMGTPSHVGTSLHTDDHHKLVDLTGKRILVVDDSKDNQVLVSRILQKLSVEVKTADDGQEAIDCLRGETFDAVLMDVQMPRLGGYEAVEILRERGLKTPIVALTAHAFQEDRDRAFAAGCNDYLTKPIDKNRLADVLSALLT